MATYDYRCPCGTELTETRRFGDNAPPECPHCKHKMKQVIGTNNFILSGKGWYKPSHHDKM